MIADQPVYSVLGRHAADDSIVVGPHGECSAGRLFDHAQAIARALEGFAAGGVVIDVASRQDFAAGMLGAWMGERSVLLAPAHGEGVDLGQPVRLGEGSAANTIDIVALRPSTSSPAIDPVVRVPAEQELVALWTSGSTGEPQVHHKTARQLLGEAETLRDAFTVGPHHRVLSTAPPQHIYGLLFGVALPLVAGASLIDAAPLQPPAVARAVRDSNANVLVSVPAHLRAIAMLDRGELSGIDRVFSSGAPLLSTTAERMHSGHELVVTEVLGSTETGGIAWRHQRSSDPRWALLPGVQCSVDDRSCLVVASPFLPAGHEQWTTSDRVDLDTDGRFEHHGRIDGVVKIGGKRVALLELERALLEIEGVRDAAVMARAIGGARDYELAALVVTASPGNGDLRAELLRRFDPVVVPRRIAAVATIPRAANGKVTRAAFFAAWDAAASSAMSAPGHK